MPEALDDRNGIWDFIAANNPQAAVKMDILFDEATTRLDKYPKLGKSGMITGTRELIPHAN
jgi:plasmid stabilization system protein ParE